MKKLIAFLIVAVLLATSICSSLATAESIEISTLRPFTSVKADGSFNAHVQPDGGYNESDFSITAVDNFTSVTSEKIIKIDSATSAAITNNVLGSNKKLNISFGGWDYSDDWMFPLSGTDALMFYVKMPAAGADTYSHFYTSLTVAWDEDKATSFKSWPQLVANKPYYLLAKDSTKWSEKKAAGGLDVALPGGFEGYIRFPWSSFGLNESDILSAYLYEMNFCPDSFGGTYGAAYIGNFYVATNAAMSKNGAKIGSSTQLINLFTGAAMAEEDLAGGDAEEEPPVVDLSHIATADLLYYASSYKNSGDTLDDVADNTINADNPGAVDVAFTLVANPTGISQYPLICWDVPQDAGAVTDNTLAKTMVTMTVTGNNWDWGYNLSGANALMFYVKAPKAASDGKARLWTSLTIGVNQMWPQIKAGSAISTLAKGETKWKNIKAETSGELPFEGGFEGWVRVPLTAYNQDISNRSLTSMRFQWLDFGAEYGPAYLGGFMVATNKNISKDGVIIGSRDMIQNLFTGETMAADQLAPDVETREVGEIYDALPNATADHQISLDGVASSTADISWEAYTGAANYRVEVYEPSYSETGIEYKYVQRIMANSSSATVTKLAADMRYYVVVCALGTDGREIGVYDSMAFFTDPESIGNDDEGDTDNPGNPGNPGTPGKSDDTSKDPSGDTWEDDDNAGSPYTGEMFSVLGAVCLLGSVGCIFVAYWVNKKRHGKRKGEKA